MDKDPELKAVDREGAAQRSGRDRRAPYDRRRSNPLRELQARREGMTDRRQRERRDTNGRAEDRWLRRAFSFFGLSKAD
jgi:hypothetical protein